MATVEVSQDRMVCYCFGLRESDIHESAQLHAATELKAVMHCTGAGTGCTACHRRIQAVLDQRVRAQCPPSSSSPTCVTR